jgi:hypothetical protein
MRFCFALLFVLSLGACSDDDYGSNPNHANTDMTMDLSEELSD